jgi:hypothetical protein
MAGGRAAAGGQGGGTGEDDGATGDGHGHIAQFIDL